MKTKLFYIVLFIGMHLFALSPEIRFDMLTTKLTQELKAQNYSQALKTMQEIKQTGMKLPASFDYFEGKALFETQRYGESVEKLEAYLNNSGKQGKYYQQTLQYYIKAKENFTITHNGTTYKTVTSPYTGRTWLDRNLGAERVCQSFDDTQCYGDYYQWGRDADGHEKRTSSSFIKAPNEPNDWEPSDSSGLKRQRFWMQTDGNGICPRGFRVPTIDELRAETRKQYTKNRHDVFNSFLKLPSTGFRDYDDGRIYGQGDCQGCGGFIWTSSTQTNSTAWRLSFHLDSLDRSSGVYYAVGMPVRCIQD